LEAENAIQYTERVQSAVDVYGIKRQLACREQGRYDLSKGF